MVKKLSNAHEDNIFQAAMSASTLFCLISFWKLLFFFFKKSHQQSPFKGLFFKFFFRVGTLHVPLMLLDYQLRAPLI